MQSIRSYFQSVLADKYPAGEIQSLLFWTLEELTGKSRTELLLCKDTEFSADIQEKARKIADMLANFRPIQYIFGKTNFCGLSFRVNEHVLIPRPETSELVEMIRKENPEENLRLLDIGTGSGCIAISLKSACPSWRVQAVDKSVDALSVARENADENGVFVQFSELDALALEPDWGQQDIIVSNPPYICLREQADMEPNVLNYEPGMALFVPDDDPLLFYRAIATKAREHLSNNGNLYFEINSAYGHQTALLLRELGYFDVDLRVDFSGLDRFVVGRWKISPARLKSRL